METEGTGTPPFSRANGFRVVSGRSLCNFVLQKGIQSSSESLDDIGPIFVFLFLLAHSVKPEVKILQ